MKYLDRNVRALLTASYLLLIASLQSFGQQLQLAKLKYEGGGDWYANKTALPNLARFCNEQAGMRLHLQEAIVEVGSESIFEYPYVYMTGHGNVSFSTTQAENLRSYLIAGGFLHIDDNYGMDAYVRTEIKKIFPEHVLVELPFDHPIYHQKYDFAKGLPKIHEHDGKPPQGFGIIHEGRLVIFYTYECDLGNGWEDATVHNDPQHVREQALKMGANIIQYAFTSGIE